MSIGKHIFALTVGFVARHYHYMGQSACDALCA